MTAAKSPPDTFQRGPKADYEEQIRGAIYGNCIGDSIGLLTEFMDKQEAKECYSRYRGKLEFGLKVEDGHRSRWEVGDWTDDSDQMILIMDSIMDHNGEIEPADFGRKLLKWARHGFPELGDYAGMGIGSTTYHVLHHPQFKDDPHSAAEDIWKRTGCVVAPNGAVMRTSILGIYKFHDLSIVRDNTIAMAKVTHADPRCVASCVAVTSAIAFMLRKEPKHFTKKDGYNIEAIIDDAYKSAKSIFKSNGSEKRWRQELKEHMYAKNIEALRLDEHHKIGYTLKTLGAGFWALRQNDFRKALETIVMEAGDADTNGAVAGALLGCKLYNKLPETWLHGLCHKKWLDARISKFLHLMWLPRHQYGSKSQAANVSVVQTPSVHTEISSEQKRPGQLGAPGHDCEGGGEHPASSGLEAKRHSSDDETIDPAQLKPSGDVDQSSHPSHGDGAASRPAKSPTQKQEAGPHNDEGPVQPGSQLPSSAPSPDQASSGTQTRDQELCEGAGNGHRKCQATVQEVDGAHGMQAPQQEAVHKAAQKSAPQAQQTRESTSQRAGDTLV